LAIRTMLSLVYAVVYEVYTWWCECGRLSQPCPAGFWVHYILTYLLTYMCLTRRPSWYRMYRCIISPKYNTYQYIGHRRICFCRQQPKCCQRALEWKTIQRKYVTYIWRRCAIRRKSTPATDNNNYSNVCMVFVFPWYKFKLTYD